MKIILPHLLFTPKSEKRREKKIKNEKLLRQPAEKISPEI